MNDKKELRKISIEKRNSLSQKERQEKSEIICEKLMPYLKDKISFVNIKASDSRRLKEYVARYA